MSGMYSDEDNDSILSAQASDVGSPMCNAPSSPQVTRSPSLVLPVISAKHENLVRVSKECMSYFLFAKNIVIY